MSKSEHRPKLLTVPVVRPHHGNTFVEEWLRRSWEAGSLTAAFAETHLIEWPANAGEGEKETAEEARYKTIADEIIEHTLDAVEAAIGEAFVRVAGEVLDRERRQR